MQQAQVALILFLVLLPLLLAAAVHQQGTAALLAHLEVLAVAAVLILIHFKAQAQQIKALLAGQKVLVVILPLVVAVRQA